MSSIRLHPEHGVNPAMDCCFWCGEARGVALLGWNGGHKAPPKLVVNYDPCESCRTQFAQGILVMEVVRERDVPDRRPPLQPEGMHYPTGRYVVLRREAMERMAGHTEQGQRALRAGRMMMPAPDFEQAFKNATTEEEGPAL